MDFLLGLVSTVFIGFILAALMNLGSSNGKLQVDCFDKQGKLISRESHDSITFISNKKSIKKVCVVIEK